MRHIAQHTLLAYASIIGLILSFIMSWCPKYLTNAVRIAMGISALALSASLLLGVIGVWGDTSTIPPLHALYGVLAVCASWYVYWMVQHLGRNSWGAFRLGIAILLLLCYRLVVTAT